MEVGDLNKKVILGLMASLLLAGVVGCSNSNSQSNDKKMNDKQTEQSAKKMNMTDKQMKNMKSNDKK